MNTNKLNNFIWVTTLKDGREFYALTWHETQRMAYKAILGGEC